MLLITQCRLYSKSFSDKLPLIFEVSLVYMFILSGLDLSVVTTFETENQVCMNTYVL